MLPLGMPDLHLYFAYPGDLDTRTGGYHYDRRLIAELRKLGVTVQTLSLPHCAPIPDARDLQIITEQLAALPDESLVMIDGLAFAVLDELAEAEAQRLHLVALCHHPLALETGLDDSLQTALMESERRALACARAVVVTSAHTGRIVAGQFSVPAGKISVALPGTDAVGFAPCIGKPPQLLTIASLIPRKGHDVLINALADIRDLDWRARFVGGDEFAPEWAASLRAQVQQAGLTDRIHFAGTVEELQPEYQSADAFVLPSRFEGYGMVFAEALAAGLPVVAARAGAVPDVVPESAGILVPVDDSAALGQALRQLLLDDTRRRQLQNGARQAAKDLPGWADTATSVRERLERVAGA